MSPQKEIIIVGAGIFGITAALELNRRGYRITVLDAGPLPNPLAASTDISKVARIEYGSDETYMAMAEKARQGWLRWNQELGDTLYHEVGLTMLTRQPMTPGGFEYESYRLLTQRGHAPQRLTSAGIAARFPAWNSSNYRDGYFNPKSGYVESGRVVAALARKAADEGITLHAEQPVSRLLVEEQQVVGVETRSGDRILAAHVIIAVGAWTPLLLPELASQMQAVGQPVFHLKPIKPEDADLFKPPHFTVFSADVSRTGWYGFPLHPRAGVIKITHHGLGRPMHPSHDSRELSEADVQSLRAFLGSTFPALVDAPVVKSHRCLYCDTLDGHFWIDRHPTTAGLTVAAGGSGHAFKFGPLLGQLTADAVEALPNPDLARFGWRIVSQDATIVEETRFLGGAV